MRHQTSHRWAPLIPELSVESAWNGGGHWGALLPSAMKRSSITETNGEWWVKRVAEPSGHWRSCLSQRLITAHSREGSSRWKCKTTVLRSNKKGLSKPVFLISPITSSSDFRKTLCFSVLWYPLYTKIPEGVGFPEAYRQHAFHNLEIRGMVSKSNRNISDRLNRLPSSFTKSQWGFTLD